MIRHSRIMIGIALLAGLGFWGVNSAIQRQGSSALTGAVTCANPTNTLTFSEGNLPAVTVGAPTWHQAFTLSGMWQGTASPFPGTGVEFSMQPWNGAIMYLTNNMPQAACQFLKCNNPTPIPLPSGATAPAFSTVMLDIGHTTGMADHVDFVTTIRFKNPSTNQYITASGIRFWAKGYTNYKSYNAAGTLLETVNPQQDYGIVQFTKGNVSRIDAENFARGTLIDNLTYTLDLNCPSSVASGTQTSSDAAIPSLDLKVNGQDGTIVAASGSTVTLSWTTANATACDTGTAPPPWGPYRTVPVNGSEPLKVTFTGTFGIQCSGQGSANRNLQDSIAVSVSQCSDEIDNDMDGNVDYPSDPGCASALDNNEYNAAAASSAPVVIPAKASTDTFTAFGPNGERPNANGIIKIPKGSDITIQWNFPGKHCVAGEGNNDWYYGEGKNRNTSGNITQGESGTVTLHNRQRIESLTMECYIGLSSQWRIPLISKTIIVVFDDLDFPPPASNTFEIIGSNGAKMNTSGVLTVPSGTDVIVQWNYPNNVCVVQQPPSPNELYSMDELTYVSEPIGALYQESVGVRVLRARTQNESYRIKCDKDSTFMVLNKPTPIDETRSMVIGPSTNTAYLPGGNPGGQGSGPVSSVPGGQGSATSSLIAAGAGIGPSVCETVCGDGIVLGDELCDDGNAIDTDTCNNNCGRVSSSSSSSSSSILFCVPGIVCPNGAICPQSGICPQGSSSSSIGACVPGTICPNNALCPQDGICPGICIPGTVCPSGDICPQDGLCPDACTPGTVCPNGALCPQDGVCPESSSSSASSTGIYSCSVNAECPSNLCIGGYCGCTTSAQCNGNACVGGFCSNIPDINGDLFAFASCITSAECPVGMLCQGGSCAPDLSMCGNGIMDPGEVCDDGNDTDIDGCTNLCLFGENMSCTSPRQCQSLICTNGICGKCTSDTQCPDDMYCAEGMCKPGTRPAASSTGAVLSNSVTIPSELAALLASGTGFSLFADGMNYELYQEMLRHGAPHAPVGNTGPESVAIMAAGASAGYTWMKMRRSKKKKE